MTTEPIDFPTNGEPLAVRLPDGRIAYLWHHHCAKCTSLDVWTETADHREHAVSARTGAKHRAPVGVFGMANGRRYELPTEEERTDQTGGRPGVGTVVLTWKDA